MRVGVDKAGGEDGVGAVQAMGGLEAGVDFGTGAHPDDAVGADGHGAVLDDAVLRVFGDHIARAPDPVRRFGGERSDKQEETTDTKHRRLSGTIL